MINRIKILPEFVINQIAAGEVIERPASILKELLENSIDANSSIVRIYVEQGGISSIKVVDDGEGIHDEDLPLVFVQHATSKVNTTDDLFNINSLGFRGEALASIASIAKVNIVSQQTMPTGTSIEVKDIFYNIPVRRKFLRSTTTEFNYLQEMFKRIALSNFTVGFMFYHNNKLIKSLPAISDNTVDNIIAKEKRIIKLFGKKFIDNSIFFNSQLNDMELSGWIGTDLDISGSVIQYCYINNRTVKDKLLNSAIKQATQKLSLPSAYCLYISLDPILFDVNVHPTKQEVRFSDPKIIYAFVYESILEAMGRLKVSELPSKSENFIYSDFNYNNNFDKLFVDVKLFPIFNNRYVIFEQKNNNSKLMLVNILDGLKWLLQKKMQKHADLISHQLIIPERIKIDYKKINNLDIYINWLEKFKFEINQIHENVLLMRSIPDCLNLLNVNINYENFMTDLVQIDLKSINDVNFINFIISNIRLERIDLYTKNDLTLIVSELTKENFCFPACSEQEFSSLIK